MFLHVVHELQDIALTVTWNEAPRMSSQLYPIIFFAIVALLEGHSAVEQFTKYSPGLDKKNTNSLSLIQK